MSKQKKAQGEKKALKKEIATKLSIIFTDIKEIVGEKKFTKNVKKATKALAAGKKKKASKKAPQKNKISDENVVATSTMS